MYLNKLKLHKKRNLCRKENTSRAFNNKMGALFMPVAACRGGTGRPILFTDLMEFVSLNVLSSVVIVLLKGAIIYQS